MSQKVPGHMTVLLTSLLLFANTRQTLSEERPPQGYWRGCGAIEVFLPVLTKSEAL